MDYRAEFELWCEKVTDPELAAELDRMKIENDTEAIEDAFYRTLEFGTACAVF